MEPWTHRGVLGETYTIDCMRNVDSTVPKFQSYLVDYRSTTSLVPALVLTDEWPTLLQTLPTTMERTNTGVEGSTN